MQFIVRKDLVHFLKKNRKMILGIFFVILFYSIYAKYTHDSIHRVFFSILGLHMDKDSFFADIIIFIFHIMVFVYIMLFLFFEMLRGNIENIFLRLSMKKWFFSKIVSIFLITFVLKICFYIMAIFISGYFAFFQILSYFCIDILFTLTIELVLFFHLILFYKNKFFFLLSGIFLVGILFIFPVPLTVFLIQEQYFFVLVYFALYVLLFLLSCLFMKKYYITLFEGSY